MDLFALTHNVTYANPSEYDPEVIVNAFHQINWDAQNFYALLKALETSERWSEEEMSFSDFICENKILKIPHDEAIALLQGFDFKESVEVKWARRNIEQVLRTIAAEGVVKGHISNYNTLKSDLAYIQKRLNPKETTTVDILIQMASRLGLCASGLRLVVNDAARGLCHDDPNLTIKTRAQRAGESFREKLWQILVNGMRTNNLDGFVQKMDASQEKWVQAIVQTVKTISSAIKLTGAEGDIHFGNQTRALLENLFGLRDTGQKDDALANLPYFARFALRKFIAFMHKRAEVELNEDRSSTSSRMNNAFISMFAQAVREEGLDKSDYLKQLLGEGAQHLGMDVEKGVLTLHGVPLINIRSQEPTHYFVEAVMLHLGFARPKAISRNAFSDYVNHAFL